MSVHTGSLVERLKARSTKAGVIGLGYVGLPLAVEFAKAGLDGRRRRPRRRARSSALAKGESYIGDVAASDVAEMVKAGRLRATTDFSVLVRGRHHQHLRADAAAQDQGPGPVLHRRRRWRRSPSTFRAGQLVILESTTYPGTTDEVVQPMLEAEGLKAGSDFFLAFSPERVDPGNPQFHTGNIPKVVGGVNQASNDAAVALYGLVVKEVVTVSNTRAAEMVKLLENTFRAVNIGLVNELALMCRDMGINVWEVIDAAKTKPFGFMPFYPGPGLGGHCIPIDPFYLSWKARQFGFESRFIELAGHINGGMPRYVVDRVSEALNSVAKPIKGSQGPPVRHGLQVRRHRLPRVAGHRRRRPARAARRHRHLLRSLRAVDAGRARPQAAHRGAVRQGPGRRLRHRRHHHQPQDLRLRRAGREVAPDPRHPQRVEGPAPARTSSACKQNAPQ